MRFIALAVLVCVAAASCCRADNSDSCNYEEFPVIMSPDGRPLLGGFTSMNEYDVDPVIELVNDLWNQATSNSNTNYYHLTCLKSAAKQIVSGTNYKVKAVFTETSCDKSKYTYKTFNKDDCLTQVEYETEDPITHECKKHFDSNQDQVFTAIKVHSFISSCFYIQGELQVYVKPWGEPIRQITSYSCNPSIQLSTDNLANMGNH